jgi:Glyoxalase/Bleomycin resistance protein/Dioxygenase superfamily
MSGEKTVANITFRIRHTMILVSDLERSIDFYTRLLGMDIQRRRDIPEQNERVGYVGYGKEDDGPSLELIESPKTRGKAAPWTGHVRSTCRIVISSATSSKPKVLNSSAGPDPIGPQPRYLCFHQGS